MKKRILIAENEAIIATDMKYILEEMGYVVPEMVCTGEEAVKKAREINPDLIISSVSLSGEIDGIKAVKYIRDHLDIPVIYITSQVDRPTIQKISEMENAEIIPKPFSKSVLSTTVNSSLKKFSADSERDSLTM